MIKKVIIGALTEQFSKSLLIFATAFMCLILAGCSGISPPPRAAKGFLDLTSWNFASKGPVPISGKWAYYRQQFLLPSAFKRSSPKKKAVYRRLPTNRSDEAFFADRFGTFHLVIKTGPVHRPMKLALRGPVSACRLWLNGRLVAEDGTVGNSELTEKPGQRKRFSIPLPASDFTNGRLDLLLQLSNFHARPPEAAKILELGIPRQIGAQWDRSRGFLIFSVSILLLMGCYHLSLFAFRPADSSPLYFGIFCLLWMIHFATFGANRWLVYYFLPGLNYLTIDRLAMLAYMFTIPFVILFFKELFPDETPSGLTTAYMVLACLLALLLFSGAWHQVSGLLVAHIVSGSAIIMSLVILSRALMHKRPLSGLILTGGIILDLCGTNDILYDLKLIHSVYLMRTGLLIFIICQSWALAIRSARAFSTAENLVDEVKEKNIALSQLDRLKDEFLANTSHELRTPLNGIIGITESMLTNAAVNMSQEVRSNLEMVVHSGRRLARLVNEILDFSQLKNSDVALKLTGVDFRSIARGVVAFLTKTQKNAAVVIDTKIPGDLPLIAGDEDRIQQILYNLLGNALKFTENGVITLAAEKAEGMMKISVSDTGRGIPEDRLNRIFEPFEQGDTPVFGEFAGTGLGLAISKKLTELHGGEIWAESEPGRGSTFTFTLPLTQSPALASAPLPQNTSPTTNHYQNIFTPPRWNGLHDPHPAGSNGFHILIVDDDPINLQVAANHLSGAGHAVRTAASGAEALKSIRSGATPDLVLLDIIMPGMSGHDVCREIRSTYAPQELPVIMLTAGGRKADLVEGFAAGANDYLDKPFWGTELIARVNSQLQLKEAFETLIENQRLKRELAHRKETEQTLQLMQRRLSELMDTVAEAVLAVNEDHEITFSNRACQDLLESSAEELLGCHILDFFTTEDTANLVSALKHRPENIEHFPTIKITSMNERHPPIVAEATITALNLDDEYLTVLLLRATAPEERTEDLQTKEFALSLIAELNRHQERLQTLEETLMAVLPSDNEHASIVRREIVAVDEALNDIRKVAESGDQTMDKSAIAVSVMNLSIDYWIEDTGQDKFDLARQSGLWKVYTNRDGWERTQTLDKYLDINTMPKKPRWRQIRATADFVLTCCQTPSPLRNQLESALHSCRHACR